MDMLWAPWRSKYIYTKKQARCIFCGNRTGKSTPARYILDRAEYSFAMLNLYPYNNGHTMVAPYRHVRDLESLSQLELIDLMQLLQKMKAVIDKKLKPAGYNIGINIGKIAGAGFDGHLHIHIVPRWNGDTNFMPVVSNTKVVSDSLRRLYGLLKKGSRHD